MSDDRPSIDTHLASTMCDIVEVSVRLENSIIIMRWRMLRGETDDVALTLHDAKKHMREMKQHFERLQYTLDKIYDEAEAARALRVVAETAA